jgi:hypothetical protein
MTARRPDRLNPQSYDARARGDNPQISVTINRGALARLDVLRGKLSRGVMIAMLIEYWDTKKRRRASGAGTTREQEQDR